MIEIRASFNMMISCVLLRHNVATNNVQSLMLVLTDHSLASSQEG